MGYTFGMKTAISIPDDVFADAEKLARELNQSRSQLYSQAVREYVARHSADSITTALDEVCADVGAERLDFVSRSAKRVLERTEW